MKRAARAWENRTARGTFFLQGNLPITRKYFPVLTGCGEARRSS